MILTMDVDLARGIQPMPFRGKVWILVRWEGRVLGELMIEDADLSAPSPLERKAMETFAPRIHSLRRFESSSLSSATPSVSVAVLGNGNPALLDGCLEAIAAADPPPLDVLLVNGEGAKQGAAHIVRSSTTRRPSRDLAMIAYSAAGELIAIVNERCRPDRGFVASLRSAFGKAPVSAVIGTIAPLRFDTYPQLAFDRHLLALRDYKRRLWAASAHPFDPISVHPSVGGGIAYRRADLIEVGLERLARYPTRRQVEFAILDRLIDSGRTVAHDPDVVTWHLHPRTRRELLSWVRDGAQDQLAYSRNQGRSGLRRVSAALLRNTGNGIRSIRSGRPLHLQADLVAFATTTAEAWRHVREWEPRR